MKGTGKNKIEKTQKNTKQLEPLKKTLIKTQILEERNDENVKIFFNTTLIIYLEKE